MCVHRDEELEFCPLCGDILLVGHDCNMTVVPLPEFGCYVSLAEYEGKKVLLSAPMNEDGSIEMSDGEPNWCEVSCVEEPGFLDAVNRVLNTEYVETDFFGR